MSDASPLIGLSRVGRLDLLPQLYGRITIPEAVHREVVASGVGKPGAGDVQAADWIETSQVADRVLVASLRAGLDEGEAEAIALAAERGADLLLMDERRGRSIASGLGLRCIGTLAVLVEARARGHLDAIRPILDDLVSRAGFWISPALRARVLQVAGE